MNLLSASWAANLSLFCSRPPFTRCGIKLSSENVKAETDALPLCFSPAAPDTAGGPELHPEAVPGEAEVPGGPRGLPEALRPHQQPAEEDPPWGGGAGGWRGGGRRGWSRRRGRRGGRGYRRAGAAEAAVPGQDEGEGAGDGLLLSKVWPGGAAALPAGALLPVSRMPVQPGYLPGTHPQPPGPSVQPGRQRLTVWTSLCRLFTKLGDANLRSRCGQNHQEESCCKFEGHVSWVCLFVAGMSRPLASSLRGGGGSEKPWFFFCLRINRVSDVNALSQRHCHL